MEQVPKEGLSLKKNIICNTIGSGIYLGLQWLITILVVRISGLEDAGILSLAMSIANVIYAIATFGMRGYQSSDIENKFDNYSYLASRIFTCVIGLLMGFGFLIFTEYNFYIKATIFAYIIFKTSEAFVDVLHGAEQKKWRMDIIGMSYTFRGVISFLLFVLVLGISKNLLLAITLMTVGVYIEIFLFDIPRFKNIVDIKKHTDYKKIWNLLVICLPLTAYGFLSNGIQAYPRYLLERVTSEEILGIYSSIATPVLIIQVASTFIFNPLITLFGELYSKNKKREFYNLAIKVLIGIVVIGILALIAASLLGEFALTLLYGEEIRNYTYLLNPIIITTVLTTIIAFLNMLLTVIRNFKTLLIGNAIGLILSVVFSNIFINKYFINGINSALIITLLVQAIYMIVVGYIKLNKHFESSLGGKKDVKIKG